jgi:hypothetical protein
VLIVFAFADASAQRVVAHAHNVAGRVAHFDQTAVGIVGIPLGAVPGTALFDHPPEAVLAYRLPPAYTHRGSRRQRSDGPLAATSSTPLRMSAISQVWERASPRRAA